MSTKESELSIVMGQKRSRSKREMQLRHFLVLLVARQNHLGLIQ